MRKDSVWTQQAKTICYFVKEPHLFTDLDEGRKRWTVGRARSQFKVIAKSQKMYIPTNMFCYSRLVVQHGDENEQFITKKVLMNWLTCGLVWTVGSKGFLTMSLFGKRGRFTIKGDPLSFGRTWLCR